MRGYLIGYLKPKDNNGHEDPALQEFSYGDVKDNGKRLKELEQGDYLFFHTTIRNKRYITGYYIIEKVMETKEAQKNRAILLKYKNPHLSNAKLIEGDTIAFGNPITSNVLVRPLVLSKELLNQLSIKPNFNPNQTDLAAMSSALRSWKKLNAIDIELLLDEIERGKNQSFLKNTYLSTEEIEQIDESDVEKFISINPESLGEGLKLFHRQLILDPENRLDLLLKDEETDELVVVEIKKGSLGKEVYKQITNYIKLVKRKFKTEKVRGIIVGSNVLAAYEEFYTEKVQSDEIRIFLYAWQFSLRDYIDS